MRVFQDSIGYALHEDVGASMYRYLRDIDAVPSTQRGQTV
jgi:hypothetical protein